MAANSIPTYSLYGETGDKPGVDWVHCETIQARSRLHNYRIEPHRHEKLFQILHLTGGEAEVVCDGEITSIAGPTVVTLPAMAVHGYTFSEAVEGTVLTLFQSRLSHLLGGSEDALSTFGLAQIVPLGSQATADQVGRDMALAVDEILGRQRLRLAAVEARITSILITLDRIIGSRRQTSQHLHNRGLQHALRFRDLVDREYLSHRPLEFYAGSIGVTVPHLNRICRQHLGDTALGVVHQRLLLEAKRHLTFTSLSAKEVALALGFDDPAYFTRFFKQRAGLSPIAFRNRQKAFAD